ncbi:hypothetical protein BHE74_00046006 [Ensete ventricosum]|nr:hypothetical protein BHE74_00046006 [Ensete ventricosum]
MCESGRAVWAPRRGYSPGIRVPQSHVTCGLSAITISSVRSCASIRGGAADAHTTAVDRNLFHKLVVGFMVAATILAAVMTRMDCRGGSAIRHRGWRTHIKTVKLLSAASHTQLVGALVNAPITRPHPPACC